MANYLFNGMELPELPEIEGYPYKYVCYHKLNCNRYEYICSSKPLEAKINYVGYGNCILISEYDSNGVEKLYHLSDGEWIGTSVGIKPIYKGDITSHWANHDIFFENSTDIYLSASCPTDAKTGEEIHDWCLHPNPTTPSTTDPQSLTAGWRVGQLIAAMRK